MKKVLVTGADGFIGSHLTEELVLKGYEVRALAYYNSFNSYGWLDTLPASIRISIIGIKRIGTLSPEPYPACCSDSVTFRI